MSYLTDILHRLLNVAAGPEHALHAEIDKVDVPEVKPDTETDEKEDAPDATE